ncbi:MAG TPA: hypothetical protein VD769_11750 [Gaiellaceae bacterium]|nr:hypothetical protein [Gaiellaceae bacterium]
MPILQIEHPVRDFESWREAFDADPVGRKRGGVRRYRILRPVDDPLYVVVELELDTLEAADSFLASLRELWRGAEARGLMASPQARIVDEVETVELG